MNFRSDLALECRDPKRATPGVEFRQEDTPEYKITRLHITNSGGARTLGKPVGRYVTIELPPIGDYAELYGAGMERAAQELRRMLPESGTVLVAGLGNSSMTPDALGPRCCAQVLATRHIGGDLAENAGLGTLRVVTCLIPGVVGRTGIESGELIAAAVREVRPAAVIAVDALAARQLSRLGCTVQITDSGIVPGSGVGNARLEISTKTLGVPVVSVGVPTVVDAATLVNSLTDGQPKTEGCEAMMVTPREVDLLIERAAKILSMAINRALQPHLSVQDFFVLIDP